MLKTPDGKLLAKDNTRRQERALVGHTDTDFLRFDMDYADSDAYHALQRALRPRRTKTYGSTTRRAASPNGSGSSMGT